MYPFASFHDLAAGRGDGLRPELVRMLKIRAALAASDVLQLNARRADGFEQAGPNPVGDVESALPDGVLRYPAEVKAKHLSKRQRRSR